MRGQKIFLRYPIKRDLSEFIALNRAGRHFYRGLASPPTEAEAFGKFLHRCRRTDSECFFICRIEDGAIAGFIAGAEWLQSNQWIEIKEGCEMPETPDGQDSKNVFVIEGGVLQVMAWCWIEGEETGGWCWCNCGGDINGDPEFDDNYYPTHWMPLPQPPIVNAVRM